MKDTEKRQVNSIMKEAWEAETLKAAKVDLHIHTRCSDGTMWPREVVEKYKNEGYEQIAVTDHDNTAGLKEALEAGKACGLDVIAGVEFSCVCGRLAKVHILGYGIDPDSEKLNSRLQQIRQRRRERNLKLIEALNHLGYELTYEEVCGEKNDDSVGKPDFARAMINRGYISEVKEVFEEGKFFESEELKQIKKERVEVKEAIGLIEEAGGFAVLAHPYQISDLGSPDSGNFLFHLKRLLPILKHHGIVGMECIRPDHTAQMTDDLIEIAKEKGLFITKGSDYHGEC